MSAPSPVELERAGDRGPHRPSTDPVGDDRVERPGQPDELRLLRLPDLLRLRRKKAEKLMLEVHNDGKSVVVERVPRGDGARRPGDARVRPVGHDGEAGLMSEGSAPPRRGRGRDVHRLRGRPAPVAGLPAGRAAAQRGRRARATATTRSSSCWTSPARPPSPRTRSSRGCSPPPTPTTRRRPASSAASPRAALRDHKAAAAVQVIDTLEEAGLPTELGEDGLVVDVELDRAERGDLDEVVHRHPARPGHPARGRGGRRGLLGALPDEDPRAHVYDIYQWVGYLQETLVDGAHPLSLRMRTRPGVRRAAAGRLLRWRTC